VELTFVGKLHKAEAVSELQIEQEEFYKEYRLPASIPAFPHYEVEILDVPAYSGSGRLHIHKSLKNGKNFMCWTADVPTKGYAKAVFTLWCVGTTYTILTGKDFSQYVTEESQIRDQAHLAEEFEKIKNALKFFEETHQIYVV